MCCAFPVIPIPHPVLRFNLCCGYSVTWGSGGLGSVAVKVGHDHKGLFQPGLFPVLIHCHEIPGQIH